METKKNERNFNDLKNQNQSLTNNVNDLGEQNSKLIEQNNSLKNQVEETKNILIYTGSDEKDLFKGNIDGVISFKKNYLLKK